MIQEWAEIQPVSTEKRLELLTPGRVAELLAKGTSPLRTYVRLGITSLAWVCAQCEMVYAVDTEDCPPCKEKYEQWFYVDRSHLSSDERIQVLKRWDYQCWYCGCELVQDATIDHQLARIQGGTHHMHNLVPACGRCNSQKGRRAVEEYREYLQQVCGGQIIFHGERGKYGHNNSRGSRGNED